MNINWDIILAFFLLLLIFFQWGHKEPEPRLRGLIENLKSISGRMRIASFLEVLTGLLHLWLSSLLHLWANVITFMASGFITFVVESYYIYGWYYFYGFITFMGDTPSNVKNNITS